MSYLVLFTWSFLAATIVPVGSEPFLIGVVRSGEAFSLPIAIATIGNTLGALTIYWLGRRAGAKWGTRLRASRAGERAGRMIDRYGKPALIFSWVPVLGDVLVGLAGAAGIGLGAFSIWIVLGKGSRYAIVAWMAVQI